jgi:AcrR family transcriptional regulator
VSRGKAPRSAETREKILEAALELFREKGFAETSMREIAATARVATGLAYYYFDSKESIVLAFYQKAKSDLQPLLEAAQSESKLQARLRAIILVKFTYFAPNRKFLGALMGHAADPHSPLSPFAEPSREIREMDIKQFERALIETGTNVPADLGPRLSRMLWMYQMGMILFWIYDRSADQERTRRLLDASLHLVTSLIGLSGLPLLGPARKLVTDVVDAMEQ